MNKRHRIPKTRGQALVEFALIFPFFLVIVVGGMVDFGMVFYSVVTLQQMANDTAQHAVEGPPNAGGTINTSMVHQFAMDQKPQWWPNANLSDTCAKSLLEPGSTALGTEDAYIVTVTLRYDMQLFTPFWSTMISATTGSDKFPLVARAVYRIPNVVRRH